MSVTLRVAPRYCGPPGRANGGYIAGLIAQHAPAPMRVRLEQPIPLDTPLALQSTEPDTLELKADDRILARGRLARLELAVPEAVSYSEALEASRAFAGFAQHAYPCCFVCGPARGPGDGLRIFAGPLGLPLGQPERVAAAWIPDASLADEAGTVRAEFISAALDCPGYFAATAQPVPLLLGEFTAQVDRRVHVEEPCVILGWRIERNGRKHEVGTALFDARGALCARARAVWIEPRAAAER
jgi:acyl-coenzyme A thioesterase PaaI-like protein